MIKSGSQKFFLVLLGLVLCISVAVVLSQEEQQPTEPLTVNHKQGHDNNTHTNPHQTSSWLPHIVACVMGVMLLVVMKTNLDYSTELECVKKSYSDYSTELERSHKEVKHLEDKLRSDEKDHHAAILTMQEEKYRKHEQDRQKSENDLKDLRSHFEDKLEKQANEYKNELRNLEHELSDSRNSLLQAKENQKQQIKGLNKKHNDEMDKLKNKHSGEIWRINKEHKSAAEEERKKSEDKLERLRRQLKTTGDDHKKGLREREAKHDGKVESLKKRVEDRQAVYEQLESKYERSLDRQLSTHVSHLAQRQKDHDRFFAAQQTVYNDMREDKSKAEERTQIALNNAQEERSQIRETHEHERAVNATTVLQSRQLELEDGRSQIKVCLPQYVMHLSVWL